MFRSVVVMVTSTSMLQVAAMQGVILIYTTKECRAVDISLDHGNTPCKTEFLLCAVLLLLAGSSLTLQTKALLVLQPQQEFSYAL